MAISETVEILEKIQECKSNLEIGKANLEIVNAKLEMAAYHVEVNRDVFPLYMSSIETFISLSIAALILSVSFREKVLGQQGAVNMGRFLVASWLCFLSAIISGASYLFIAAKHVELRYSCTSFEDQWGFPPSYLYTSTLILFVLGAFFLVFSVLKQTLKRDT